MTELRKCFECHVTPELRRVGDWKQYLVYVCPQCNDTPVRSGEARLTERGARKIWNKRVDEVWTEAIRRMYG